MNKKLKWLMDQARDLDSKGYLIIPVGSRVISGEKRLQPLVSFSKRKTSLAFDDPLWKEMEMVGLVLRDSLFVDYDGNKKGPIITIKGLAKKIGVTVDSLSTNCVQQNAGGDSLHYLYNIPGGFDESKLFHNQDGQWEKGIDLKCGNQLLHIKYGKEVSFPPLEDLLPAPVSLLSAITKDGVKIKKGSGSGSGSGSKIVISGGVGGGGHYGTRPNSPKFVESVTVALGKIDPRCSGEAWRKIVGALSYQFGGNEEGHNLARLFSKGKLWTGEKVAKKHLDYDSLVLEDKYYNSKIDHLNPAKIETVFGYAEKKKGMKVGRCGAYSRSGGLGVVELLRKKGITKSKNNGAPILKMSVMFPGEKIKKGSLIWKKEVDRVRENNFSRIVKSVLYNQEGIYNPEMAFWCSLVYVDFLAGCGYESVNSQGTAPLYVFTSGQTSDGKTTTINAVNRHIYKFLKEGDTNKIIIDNVGSAQGLEDSIIYKLSDGCDIFYSQDEYGLKEGNSKEMDKAGREMRGAILKYKTLSRDTVVNPRALSKAGSSGKSTDKREPKQCVHFNYFTTTTDETLVGVLGDSVVGQGYTQRFIGGTSNSHRKDARYYKLKKNVNDDPSLDRKTKKILASIIKNSNSVVGVDRVKGGLPVKVEVDAIAYLSEVGALGIKSDDVAFNKIGEAIGPVARIRAIIENPTKPVIDLGLMKWAHTVVSCSILYFKWLIGDLKKMESDRNIDVGMVVENKIIEVMEKKGAIDKKSAVSRNNIMGNCNFGRMNINATKYRPIWEALVEMGRIEKVEKKMGSGQVSYNYFVRVFDID